MHWSSELSDFVLWGATWRSLGTVDAEDGGIGGRRWDVAQFRKEIECLDEWMNYGWTFDWLGVADGPVYLVLHLFDFFLFFQSWFSCRVRSFLRQIVLVCFFFFFDCGWPTAHYSMFLPRYFSFWQPLSEFESIVINECVFYKSA